MIENRAVVFLGGGRVEVRSEPAPRPGPGEVLVRTLVSAPSAGTEMLAYRGQLPPALALDESIPGMQTAPAYPLKYGYGAVGKVEAGDGLEPGTRVFALHPHEARFAARPEDLVPLPDDVSTEDAAFLANAETAVNLVLDGRPLLGEKVAVVGQGVVGLLLTAALAAFPLAALVAVEPAAARRKLALAAGATAACATATEAEAALEAAGPHYRGADLVFEVSGNPAALDAALSLAGRNGRVVVASWYGTKPATLDLGGRFHRDRITVASSQVSTIAPELSMRWTRDRRLAGALDLVRRARPAAFVSHRFPVDRAAEAYRLIDQAPEGLVQVLFTYTQD